MRLLTVFQRTFELLYFVLCIFGLISNNLLHLYCQWLNSLFSHLFTWWNIKYFLVISVSVQWKWFPYWKMTMSMKILMTYTFGIDFNPQWKFLIFCWSMRCWNSGKYGSKNNCHFLSCWFIHVLCYSLIPELLASAIQKCWRVQNKKLTISQRKSLK